MNCNTEKCAPETRETEVVKGNGATSVVTPRYRSRRVEQGYAVTVLVPGVAKGDVEVRVEDGVLTVTAERHDVVPEQWKPLREELVKKSYRLRVTVPEDVDDERIGAAVEDGVLELSLPVRESAKPRVIPVA